MHESDNVTTQFKTLKWLCISFREKPKSEWPISLSWCAPPTFWSHLLTSPYPPFCAWIPWSFHSTLTMTGCSCHVQNIFIYGSSACISLSSDILIAPSPISFNCVQMCPLHLGASWSPHFKYQHTQLTSKSSCSFSAFYFLQTNYHQQTHHIYLNYVPYCRCPLPGECKLCQCRSVCFIQTIVCPVSEAMPET